MNDDVMMMFSLLNEYKYMYIPHSIWNKKIKFNYVTYDAEDVVRCIRAWWCDLNSRNTNNDNQWLGDWEWGSCRIFKSQIYYFLYILVHIVYIYTYMLFMIS